MFIISDILLCFLKSQIYINLFILNDIFCLFSGTNLYRHIAIDLWKKFIKNLYILSDILSCLFSEASLYKHVYSSYYKSRLE